MYEIKKANNNSESSVPSPQPRSFSFRASLETRNGIRGGMSGSSEHGTLLPALSLAALPGRDPGKGLSHHGLQSSHLQKAPEHCGALRHGALTICLAGMWSRGP